MAEFVEITSAEELREVMGTPLPRTQAKVRTRLHEVDRQWIAKSPFCLVGTADAAGGCDVSPKGDPAGFTLVLDDRTIVLPERPGNRRADGFLNILQNPRVGLLYVIPGRGDTLRVTGRARLIREAPFFDQLIVQATVRQSRCCWRSRRSSTTAPRRSCGPACGSRVPGSRASCRRRPASPRRSLMSRRPWRNWSATTAPPTWRSCTAEPGLASSLLASMLPVVIGSGS
jgi:predicted pyridoxine 5'-phosphate oxidase superfamily flavin-nucleotide-binding protein